MHSPREALAPAAPFGDIEDPRSDSGDEPLDPLEVGYLLGLLVGEGHFGGDGVQPHVTLKMHTRHERLFRWLEATFPGGRLYGPYEYERRRFYQWMCRGTYLREVLVPLLAPHRELMDDHVGARFDAMCDRYRIDRTLPPPSRARIARATGPRAGRGSRAS